MEEIWNGTRNHSPGGVLWWWRHRCVNTTRPSKNRWIFHPHSWESHCSSPWPPWPGAPVRGSRLHAQQTGPKHSAHQWCFSSKASSIFLSIQHLPSLWRNWAIILNYLVNTYSFNLLYTMHARIYPVHSVPRFRYATLAVNSDHSHPLPTIGVNACWLYIYNALCVIQLLIISSSASSITKPPLLVHVNSLLALQLAPQSKRPGRQWGRQPEVSYVLHYKNHELYISGCHFQYKRTVYLSARELRSIVHWLPITELYCHVDNMENHDHWGLFNRDKGLIMGPQVGHSSVARSPS